MRAVWYAWTAAVRSFANTASSAGLFPQKQPSHSQQNPMHSTFAVVIGLEEAGVLQGLHMVMCLLAQLQWPWSDKEINFLRQCI